ncbi:UNVERIFIED_CONTAM: hypothetical protein PYX00_000180 [Menopon gallinae]|uniref:Uncharacterized protein n=1 Tax=Menopon gallinae TaxID=328185 RepID=A0AAW2I7Z8_9NEOP
MEGETILKQRSSSEEGILLLSGENRNPKGSSRFIGKKLIPEFKSIHESLTNVRHKKKNHSLEASLSDERSIDEEEDEEDEHAKPTFEDDIRNIGKLIANLQSIADSISAKYEKEFDLCKTKQLNFRSQDDIINEASDFLIPSEQKRRSRKPPRISLLQSQSFPPLSRTKSEADPAFFFVNERLIDSKSIVLPEIKWSDANSITSPCSTVPDSPFESRNRYRKKFLRYPKRSVLKNGECNVLKKSSLSKRRLRYLQDIFTTLVDVKWRWTLIVFALSFIMSWLFYAGIYWLIAYAHGDFEHLEDESWTPCVQSLNNFASCFLFSVETQHTIGYGGRSTNEECPEAIFVMCIQSITGVMISAFMAGIFFAKMARPKQRRQTLLFSRKAVICQRDGQLCLMFRVGDMRKSHIIGTNITAHIFRTRTTREGEELPQYQCELTVSADGCDSNLFFIWPLTMVHVIDRKSPLYSISAQELLHETFEIVAILEGTVESTGQTTQARTSYLPGEIKWGHRFESILSYNEERQSYEVDYKKFNNTVKVSTPLCSARDLDDLDRLYRAQSELPESHTIDMDVDN